MPPRPAPVARGDESSSRADAEGKWCLMNPLAIHFSQPRVKHHFRDGHLVSESEAALRAEPFVKSAGGAEGEAPAFDSVLLPPFPTIRVISWLPKLRSAEGTARRNANGDQLLGDRAWFALDNRRLLALQRTAVARWPAKCCIAVRVLEEVPGQTIGELRKFRTTTQGRSVEVGDEGLWCWRDSLAKSQGQGAQLPESIEPEGLFAEDLWDAWRWAQAAVEEALAAEARDNEAHSSRGKPRPLPPPKEEPPKPTGPELVRCPETGWQYVDPKGQVQGPFNLAKMRLWHQYGYFAPSLPMRCAAEDEFKPFSNIFAGGLKPFESNVLRHKA